VDAKAVIKRLCELQRDVSDVLGYHNAADCFCGQGGLYASHTSSDAYRNDGVSLEFIENATRAALRSRQGECPSGTTSEQVAVAPKGSACESPAPLSSKQCCHDPLDGRFTMRVEYDARAHYVGITCSACGHGLHIPMPESAGETRAELQTGDEVEYIDDGDTGVIVGLDPDTRVFVRWKGGHMSTPLLRNLRRSPKTPCRTVPGGGVFCPECKTELAFDGDVCGLCHPEVQP
jgi:hypothetical protein